MEDIHVILELYRASELILFPDERDLEKQNLRLKNLLEQKVSSGVINSSQLGRNIEHEVCLCISTSSWILSFWTLFNTNKWFTRFFSGGACSSISFLRNFGPDRKAAKYRALQLRQYKNSENLILVNFLSKCCLLKLYSLELTFSWESSSPNIGNKDFLSLSVEDYNKCQAIHREELKELERYASLNNNANPPLVY